MHLKYLHHYPEHLQQSIMSLIEKDKLGDYLLNRYPSIHDVVNDKLLRQYVQNMKNQYLKKSDPINQIQFDSKIHVINNALGQHHFTSRVQGSKLKRKNAIRISDIFKTAPEPFLEMIVAHELAHVKEKEHNKAFYKLCQHMCSDYFQLEFDVRVYLTQLDLFDCPYAQIVK